MIYDIIIENIGYLIVIGGYLFLLGTSGILVKKIISYISKDDSDMDISQREKDTGFVIGKCENVLLLTFMLLNAYTALALIFVAKTVVRKEDMSKNTLYFLSGSMINVTYSITIAVIIKTLLNLI
ncbi:MAG: hypothetical protein ACOC5D_05805 [Thermoplasmatota archaeon]